MPVTTTQFDKFKKWLEESKQNETENYKKHRGYYDFFIEVFSDNNKVNVDPVKGDLHFVHENLDKFKDKLDSPEIASIIRLIISRLDSVKFKVKARLTKYISKTEFTFKNLCTDTKLESELLKLEEETELNQQAKEIFDNMTSEQKEAVRHYVDTDTYKDFVNAIKDPKQAIQGMEQKIEILRELTELFEFKKDITLYSGLIGGVDELKNMVNNNTWGKISKNGEIDLDLLKKNLPGKFLIDPNFFSTSQNKGVAYIFITKELPVGKNCGVLFKIKAKEGQRCLPVMSSLDKYDEREVLLSKDTKIKVTKVKIKEHEPYKKITIYGDLVQ